MKYQVKNELFKSCNNKLKISKCMTKISATSYGWWKYVFSDNVGNIVFNFSMYSSSTRTHQYNVEGILRNLGLKPCLKIYNVTDDCCDIPDLINTSIENFKKEIKELNELINKKGTWRVKNKERKLRIESILFEIKDLNFFLENYYNKKRLVDKSDKNTNNDFSPFFKKPNGKLQKNELNELYLKLRYNTVPPTLENFKKLGNYLDIKNTKNKISTLSYRFIADLCRALPSLDSKDSVLLKRYIKTHEIKPNALGCEILHQYFINKEKRVGYVEREPEILPYNKKLDQIKHEKLTVFKTDKQVKKEGRQQGHCIGTESMGYLNKLRLGYNALNFKGYTFFLSPELEVIEAHGRHNSDTPSEVINELELLIA